MTDTIKKEIDKRITVCDEGIFRNLQMASALIREDIESGDVVEPNACLDLLRAETDRLAAYRAQLLKQRAALQPEHDTTQPPHMVPPWNRPPPRVPGTPLRERLCNVFHKYAYEGLVVVAVFALFASFVL